MLDFIINSLLWTLALYGLIEIIKICYYTFTYKNMQSDGIYFIIAVKNKEQKIEGILRSILSKVLYAKEEQIKNIIVTDREKVFYSNIESIINKEISDQLKEAIINRKELELGINITDKYKIESNYIYKPLIV